VFLCGDLQGTVTASAQNTVAKTKQNYNPQNVQ